MLPEIKMVRAKAHVESLYHGICKVETYEKAKQPNGSTKFAETILYENVPCRLSYSTLSQAYPNEDASSTVAQTVKLFLSPSYTVPAGSKITVTQYGKTEVYKASGMPAVHLSHQEILLDEFKGWS